MKDALLRAIGVALDGIEVGYCAFDAQDRTLAWNNTFLELFPEHDGRVHLGEPYTANLRRFYEGRLTGDERLLIERYIDEGVRRHRVQRRPYEFDHRDFRVRVSSFEIGSFGRLRVWRKVATLPQRVELPVSSTVALRDLNAEGVLERLSDGVAIFDVADKLMWANQSFTSMYGVRSLDAAVGKSFNEVYRDAWSNLSNACDYHESLATLAEGQRFSGAPFELRLPDNRWVRVVEQRGTVDGRGYFVHLDITDLKRQQAALQEAEQRYRLVAEYSSDIILVVNGGRVTYASPAVTEVLAWPSSAVLGKSLTHFCHPDDIPEVGAALNTLRGQPEADYRARALHREGHYVWVEARARRLPGTDNPLKARLVINLRSITARKAVEDQLAVANHRLQELATSDGLTGLANRRHFDESLDAECRRAVRGDLPLALLLLDLDNFKRLNDAHGHQAGDEVLRRLGAVLKGFANRAGDLAARYGGEEFALLLPNTSLVQALRTAESVRAAVQAMELPVLYGGQVTVSIGAWMLASTSGPNLPDLLVMSADEALYEAKRTGKNCVRASSTASAS
jgi:diguanylate cyclase (GGDEF)-like protein/PAS domain S-box-containing protein